MEFQEEQASQITLEEQDNLSRSNRKVKRGTDDTTGSMMTGRSEAARKEGNTLSETR